MYDFAVRLCFGPNSNRADLLRWSAANAHGRQMHEAIDLLERSLPTTNPTEAYAVAHAALASPIKVIARADDSSGIIGDACRRLLGLHPRLAANAQVQPTRLVDWMIKFQLCGDVDYFEIDPVALRTCAWINRYGHRPTGSRIFTIQRKRSKESERLTWHSIGPTKPATTRHRTEHYKLPSTDANCWPDTARLKLPELDLKCSPDGQPLPPLRVCMPPQATRGMTTRMKSFRLCSHDHATWFCFLFSRSRTHNSPGAGPPDRPRRHPSMGRVG